MTKPLVPDAPWVAVEPLPPPERPKPKGGRPRADDRAALVAPSPGANARRDMVCDMRMYPLWTCKLDFATKEA
jgi:transposase